MQTILAIGPHPDDIELGCFGTLARYSNEGNKVIFLVMTQGEGGTDTEDRILEAKKSSELISSEILFESLKDRYVSEGPETISKIEKHINFLKPDIVFLPSKQDTHQDHRAIHHAGIVAARNVNKICIYQAPSTTVDFRPNFYVDISDYIGLKVQAVKIHTSQNKKIYMADKAITGLAEYRSFEVLKNGKFFEAFEIYREII